MRDCGAIIGEWRCRAPARMVDPEKILNFFQKTGANLPPCLAITPIEGHLVTGGKRLFFKKAGKTLIVFKKNPNIRYGSFLKKVEKKGE